LVDQERDYFYLGRNDTQVKHQCYRIELGEIEDAANRIAGIKMLLPLQPGNQKSADTVVSGCRSSL
jgi:hypothetical protein